MICDIKENAEVSLHDCRTGNIQCDRQNIKFFFPDGFYLLRDVKNADAVKVRSAEVTCRFCDKSVDRFCVTVYRKNIFGQTVRKDVTDKFISEINGQNAEFEFVYTYRSYHKILFKGYIYRHKKPWCTECEIELMTDEIVYSWEAVQT